MGNPYMISNFKRLNYVCMISYVTSEALKESDYWIGIGLLTLILILCNWFYVLRHILDIHLYKGFYKSEPCICKTSNRYFAIIT